MGSEWCQESCGPTEANRKGPGMFVCLGHPQVLKKVTEPLRPVALCTLVQGIIWALRQVLGRFSETLTPSLQLPTAENTHLSLQTLLKTTTKKLHLSFSQQMTVWYENSPTSKVTNFWKPLTSVLLDEREKNLSVLHASLTRVLGYKPHFILSQLCIQFLKCLKHYCSWIEPLNYHRK